MPLYEYQCAECGHRFEVLQRIGESADGLACPRCGEPKLDKLLSTFAAGAGSGASSASAAAGSAGPACGPGFT